MQTILVYCLKTLSRRDSLAETMSNKPGGATYDFGNKKNHVYSCPISFAPVQYVQVSAHVMRKFIGYWLSVISHVSGLLS